MKISFCDLKAFPLRPLREMYFYIHVFLDSSVRSISVMRTKW